MINEKNKDLITQLRRQKDEAYWERNQLVLALSKIFRAELARHSPGDMEWDDDWRNIVVVYIPTEVRNSLDQPIGTYQLTWHVHKSELGYFDHLQFDDEYFWDGHTTDQKYRRLRTLKAEDFDLIRDKCYS